MVSILTRPEGRVLLAISTFNVRVQTVSILTRPEGRVLHAHTMATEVKTVVSILTRPEGRVLRELMGQRPYCVNVSILTRPEGRVLLVRRHSVDKPLLVSILTRPEGRVLRKAEAGSMSNKVFQSSPDPKAGCYAIMLRRSQRLMGFNPHPTRRPGATQRHESLRAGNRVSILTRPEGRVLLLFRCVQASFEAFQSSPDPKAGCYLSTDKGQHPVT